MAAGAAWRPRLGPAARRRTRAPGPRELPRGRGKRAGAPRGPEYAEGLNCCYSYHATSLALACRACKRRTTSHLAGLRLAGKAAGFRAGQPGRASSPDSLTERAAASPVCCVPGEDCVLAGRCGFGGLRMHRCGALFTCGGGSATRLKPAGWSQRTRPGTRLRRSTRPMEVTSAPNPVSTIGFAYPRCGSSVLTASRSGSLP